MRLISAAFQGFVAIDKKSLFLRGSVVIIALSVKGKGTFNSDFHIKKLKNLIDSAQYKC
jgi:hypothetical protein